MVHERACHPVNGHEALHCDASPIRELQIVFGGVEKAKWPLAQPLLQRRVQKSWEDVRDPRQRQFSARFGQLPQLFINGVAIPVRRFQAPVFDDSHQEIPDPTHSVWALLDRRHWIEPHRLVADVDVCASDQASNDAAGPITIKNRSWRQRRACNGRSAPGEAVFD